MRVTRRPRISIVVHGGAGAASPELRARRLAGLEKAAAVGMQRLAAGKSALDAVIDSVSALEDDPLFNAGTGSVLTLNGNVEMDATLMTGQRRCGGVAALSRVRNPIWVARLVMEHTDHSLLAGEGALRFARLWGVSDHDPVTPERRQRWEELRAALLSTDDSAAGKLRYFNPAPLREYMARESGLKYSTVGAVARDEAGLVVAGTSTGGLWLKLPGRVGDTGIFGAGTWAGPAGGASATGHGEGIIRLQLTRLVVDLMKTMPAPEACARAMRMARRQGVEAGVIAVDRRGRIGAAFNAEEMLTARLSAPRFAGRRG